MIWFIVILLTIVVNNWLFNEEKKMDDTFPEGTPLWFKLWATKAETRRHRVTLKFIAGNALAILAMAVGVILWIPTKGDVTKTVVGLATKESVTTLTKTVEGLVVTVDGLATKQGLQKEIRMLRKELLENDREMLRWVLGARANEAVRQAIRDKLVDLDSKIQNLDKALADNLSEIPDSFKPAMGKIEQFEPDSGRLLVRTLAGKLLEGKIETHHASRVELIQMEGIVNVPMAEKFVGLEIDLVFEELASGKTRTIWPKRIYEKLEKEK